MFITYTLF